MTVLELVDVCKNCRCRTVYKYRFYTLEFINGKKECIKFEEFDYVDEFYEKYGDYILQEFEVIPRINGEIVLHLAVYKQENRR